MVLTLVYAPSQVLMRAKGNVLVLSASDLASHLGCRHRTRLDVEVAVGRRKPPPYFEDPAMEALRARGFEHEQRYVESLTAGGLDVMRPEASDQESLAEATLRAMRGGVGVIVQGALEMNGWIGRPDVLVRVARESELGSWSYEAHDTKLASETRAGAVLQLCVYCDLLAAVQGIVPDRFWVVTPSEPFVLEEHRFDAYAAYFRHVRAELIAQTATEDIANLNGLGTYPDPTEQCDYCRWWSACNTQRRADDHLSFVAGISKLQMRELQRGGVTTLEKLGLLERPLAWKPKRGSVETYERVMDQARLQLTGRRTNEPVFELLEVEPGFGLTRLPEPSAGDMFLDIEGDSFAREGGREYLFGLVTKNAGGDVVYRRWWAFTDAEEHAAFEAVVDTIHAVIAEYPTARLFHYGGYEPGTMKRLMGRYATREEEIDAMLRAGRFVDLCSIVKQSLRASVERYSIKDLERFYSFKRDVDLRVAGRHRHAVERALELGHSATLQDQARDAVEGYNRDDCVSAARLRDWLEELRAQVESTGHVLTRPTLRDSEAHEELDERTKRVRALGARLREGVPEEQSERSAEQQGRWLLSHLLEWHRRELKAGWWEYHRLNEGSDAELVDERAALSGLRHVARLDGGTTKCPIDRYSFPQQDAELRDGDELYLPGHADLAKLGKIVDIDLLARTVDIKKTSAEAETHPVSAFTFQSFDSDVMADSIERLANSVLADGFEVVSKNRAATELVRCAPPRLRNLRLDAQRSGESTTNFAARQALALDGTVLPIQGPPGSGKTHTGARMIVELVRAGKRVGVTATSHKVIRNLLEKVLEAARETSTTVSCVRKPKEGEKKTENDVIRLIEKSDRVLAALRTGEAQVAGGTSWLWSREDFYNAVDVLFVDEAGQMSLANVLAVAQAANSVVLLGDPQQLQQPQQGSHPEGADVSALDHVLAGHATMPHERGLFLPETWRLAPAVCDFTSELFYERRLDPAPRTRGQRIDGSTVFTGAGLWYVPVEHEGNQSSSIEEAAIVERIARMLVDSGTTCTDAIGTTRPLAPADILIVAPYNAQVAALGERLTPTFDRIGTVDRFQGQEAPVVIYSMATSSPEEAPHGTEFLYSLNRLNVATSRAQCACILVASTRLFEPECRTPRQMQLANAYCRYRELARVIDPRSVLS